MTTPQQTASNGWNPLVPPIFDHWAEATRTLVDQSQQLFHAVAEARDLETLQKRWLESIAQSLDQYMRSPVFLDMMRRNFELVTQLQDSYEDRARDVARATGVPRLDDISGLFERMRIGQDALMERLAQLEKRLQSLEEKLAPRA